MNNLPLRFYIPGYFALRKVKSHLQSFLQNGSQESKAAPHVDKIRHLKELQKQYNLSCLIESGTYLGEMVSAMQESFDEIHTIEVSSEIYSYTKNRKAWPPHVHFHLGDSARLIGQILSQTTRPTLIWLDGHYSGGITAMGSEACPILQELNQIHKANPASAIVIVVDDKRCFNGTQGYPTLDELKCGIREISNEAIFSNGPDSLIAIINCSSPAQQKA